MPQRVAILGGGVAVLSAAHDLGARPYAVRHRVHEGLPVAEVVSLRAQDSVEAGYDDTLLTEAASTPTP